MIKSNVIHTDALLGTTVAAAFCSQCSLVGGTDTRILALNVWME